MDGAREGLQVLGIGLRRASRVRVSGGSFRVRVNEDISGKFDVRVICHFAALIIVYNIGTGPAAGEQIVK